MDGISHKKWIFPNPEKTRDSLLPKLALKPWISSRSANMLLTNASIIDSAAGRLLSGRRSILVRNGLIQEVSEQPILAPDCDSINLNGLFVCPGLIDCHVHVTAVPGVKTMGELMETPEELIQLRTSYVLRETIRRGFTTVRDTGGASKALADAIEEGLLVGPRLFQCGKALSQTGGHGDFGPTTRAAGCCGGHWKSLGRTCDGVPEVLKATREELKLGADFIKVMCGGGVASVTDAIETVQFTPEEIQAITSTCRQMGRKKTTAHAYTIEAITHAIENGIQCIEHGNLMDERCAKMMATKGIFLTPTLSCYGIMERAPFEDFLPENGKVKNKQVMSQGLNAIKIAEAAGVTVCYGTDLLTSMQALQTEEFTVRAAVLPSPTILKHATVNAAALLDMTGKLGVIAPAAFGDLIILNTNPLDDIRILDRPEDHLLAVIKGGKVVSSRLEELAMEYL
ncbi:hypothetical protein BS47DRAFT_1298935 [Hydnum rufescens UP504]|uniref:Amidohydrolase-related domain-containing protein n=1 Tax=Hydnum rufescens UP504 TaxID=1448309 RepID=A0A9P6AT49_9AGAM|nr:hypothetical protein BS47DRAFT_1298935 [Hydnum rufescens UP504]